MRYARIEQRLGQYVVRFRFRTDWGMGVESWRWFDDFYGAKQMAGIVTGNFGPCECGRGKAIVRGLCLDCLRTAKTASQDRAGDAISAPGDL